MTVFSDIYRDNLWNGIESRSGPGSGLAATAKVAPRIVELIETIGIRSVLNIGCGDDYWMPDLPRYTGIDVAPEAIELAQANHPDRRYAVLNARVDPLPKFDLVILRDVIQHLPLADGFVLLARIRASGSRYLLASTYISGVNVDIEAGDCYAPDMEAEPFAVGETISMIFDGYGYDNPDAIRDPHKYLGLWLL